MTESETRKTVGAMMVYYPNFTPTNADLMITLWTDAFADRSYEEVATALKTYVMGDKSGFAPSIGALNSIIVEVGNKAAGNELNEMQAWNLVSKALRDGIYHSKERFDELPALVKKAVGSPDNLRNWAQSDMETIETVIMSNFQRTYRAEVTRSKETQMYPTEVRTMIEQATQKLIGKEDYE